MAGHCIFYQLGIIVSPMRLDAKKIEQFEVEFLTIDFDSGEVPSANLTLLISSSHIPAAADRAHPLPALTLPQFLRR